MGDSSPNSHHILRSSGLRQARTPPGRKLVGPCHQGDATGHGQPIKSPFDPLEPTIDIALKNFRGVWSKNPKVPRTTRCAGKRVGHGERLLTIGGHLRHPSGTAEDGIPPAATMLLDDARAPFGVAPRLPLRWLHHHVDPALRVDGQKAEAQETTELLHSCVVLPAAPPLGGADGEPDLVANGCAINRLKHQFEREALLHLADYDEFG